MARNKRRASANASHTTSERSPKKQKLTTPAAASTSNAMTTAQKKDEAMQWVLDSLSAQDAAVYKRIYNNAGKSRKGASRATIEHAIVPLHDFLVARPETLRLHNQFALAHHAWSKQAVPLPYFPELEQKDKETITTEAVNASPCQEVPTANIRTSEGPPQQDVITVAHPANPIAMGAMSNNTPHEQTENEHSTRHTMAAENGADMDSQEGNAPNELGRAASLAFPFHAPVVESSPLFRDNISKDTGSNPAPDNAAAHANLDATAMVIRRAAQY